MGIERGGRKVEERGGVNVGIERGGRKVEERGRGAATMKLKTKVYIILGFLK